MIFIENNFSLIWLSLVSGAAVVFEVLGLLGISHLNSDLSPWVFALFALSAGFDVFKSAFKALKNKRWHSISVLVSVATIVAFFLGEYLEGSLVLTLFALGERLEEFGHKVSKAAIENLVQGIPKLVESETGDKILLENVVAGTIIVLRAGDIVAIDGLVDSGSGVVDEASITGESLPKAKATGDKILSGSKVINGFFKIQTTTTSSNSTLQRVQEITLKAIQDKSEFQRFIERFSKIYTPLVLILSALVFAIPVLFLNGNPSKWLEQALTLLIISCPCALVISTPLSIFAAIGSAAKKGIIIKGGRYLEALSKINIMALDKTRTLTVGKPKVVSIKSFAHLSEAEVIADAAGIETFSEHPLAQSIVQAAREYKTAHHTSTNYETVMGKGAKAECLICQDGAHFIGSKNFALEQIKLKDSELLEVQKIEALGQTPILLWRENEVLGLLAVEDPLKENAQSVLLELGTLGIETMILSGDNSKVVRAIGDRAGAKSVHGELLPHDKAKFILAQKNQGKIIAMVGDGINDAPALATADIGIAMGMAGSDLAVETANVALMNDNLDLLPLVVKLARRTWSTIRLNTFIALGTKGTVLILAAFGKGSLPIAIFSDVGVLFVVMLFSLRLLKV